MLLWYAALLALALLVSVVLTRQLLVAYLDQRATSDLTSELSDLRSAVRASSSPADEGQSATQLLRAALNNNPPEAGAGVAVILNGRVVSVQGGRWMESAASGRLIRRWNSVSRPVEGTVATPSGPARYRTEQVRLPGTHDRVVVAAAVLLGPQSALVSEVTRIEIEAALGVLLVATVIGWLIARRLVRPLANLTEVARSISETELGRRIPVDGHDEVSVLAETFNEMLERLDLAFETQQEFVHDASHELRTPITIIRGQLEVMSDAPEDRQATMALVFDELDRMDRLVRDLLTLAGLSQPGTLHIESVELSQLMEEIFSKATTLGRRAWRLEDNFAEASVDVDRHRITQAVLQLVANAVHHSTAGQAITLGCRLDGGEVRFTVTDQGPGIPQGQHQRIFERFSRGQADGSKSDGAGLGLAIVRAIAVAHGGAAGVESTPPGEGATFWLSVPRGRRALPVEARQEVST